MITLTISYILLAGSPIASYNVHQYKVQTIEQCLDIGRWFSETFKKSTSHTVEFSCN